MSEQHADGSGSRQPGELLGAGEAARDRPDATAEARDEVVVALVDDGERVPAKQLGEGGARRRAKKAPPHDAPEQARVGQADLNAR